MAKLATLDGTNLSNTISSSAYKLRSHSAKAKASFISHFVDFMKNPKNKQLIETLLKNAKTERLAQAAKDSAEAYATPTERGAKAGLTLVAIRKGPTLKHGPQLTP